MSNLRRGASRRDALALEITDIAQSAGLRNPIILGVEDHKSYIVETAGCGAAFLDYLNDGWLDILLHSGTRLDGAPEPAIVYTRTIATDVYGCHGQGWLDANGVGLGYRCWGLQNDGFDDLFVTYRGQNVLYPNNGDGTITGVREKSGLLGTTTRWGSGCTFLDYDRNGHLDLLVANYLDLDLKSAPKPGSTSNCNWQGILRSSWSSSGVPSLYRNNGNGTFTDVRRNRES